MHNRLFIFAPNRLEVLNVHVSGVDCVGTLSDDLLSRISEVLDDARQEEDLGSFEHHRQKKQAETHHGGRTQSDKSRAKRVARSNNP